MANKLLLCSIVLIMYITSEFESDARPFNNYQATVTINNIGCDCVFKRTNYSISGGEWINEPPEEIPLNGEVTIISHHSALESETVSTELLYNCGKYFIGEKWEFEPDQNPHFYSKALFVHAQGHTEAHDTYHKIEVNITRCD